MAERRMFTQKIVDSDFFLDLPLSSQCLYFHLNMRADDDGFINNPKRIQRMIGASEDDLKLLLAKRFVLGFDSGVIVIKHWRMHNLLRKDRYNPTQYQEEFQMLDLKDNGAYTEAYTEVGNQLATNWQPTGNQLAPQDRIGKDSIGKDIDISSEIAQQCMDAYNSICTSMPKAVKLSEKRKKKIRARLKEYSPEEIRKAFEKAEASEFLSGRSGKWRADFDWIIDSDHMTKILEGRYDDVKAENIWDKAMRELNEMKGGAI